MQVCQRAGMMGKPAKTATCGLEDPALNRVASWNVPFRTSSQMLWSASPPALTRSGRRRP